MRSFSVIECQVANTLQRALCTLKSNCHCLALLTHHKLLLSQTRPGSRWIDFQLLSCRLKPTDLSTGGRLPPLSILPAPPLPLRNSSSQTHLPFPEQAQMQWSPRCLCLVNMSTSFLGGFFGRGGGWAERWASGARLATWTHPQAKASSEKRGFSLWPSSAHTYTHNLKA